MQHCVSCSIACLHVSTSVQQQRNNRLAVEANSNTQGADATLILKQHKQQQRPRRWRWRQQQGCERTCNAKSRLGIIARELLHCVTNYTAEAFRHAVHVPQASWPIHWPLKSQCLAAASSQTHMPLPTSSQLTYHSVDVSSLVEQPLHCLQVAPLGSIMQTADGLRQGLCERDRQHRQHSMTAQHMSEAPTAELAVTLLNILLIGSHHVDDNERYLYRSSDAPALEAECLTLPAPLPAAALPAAAAAASAAAPGCCPLMFMPLSLALIFDINSVSSQYLRTHTRRWWWWGGSLNQHSNIHWTDCGCCAQAGSADAHLPSKEPASAGEHVSWMCTDGSKGAAQHSTSQHTYWICQESPPNP